MKFKFLIFMFVFCCLAFTGVQGVWGATYYIDFVSGNDANNGTSISTPWQHFPTDARATGNADRYVFSSGDKLVFKRGVVYRVVAADLRVTNAPSGITVTSQSGWGTGERAILDGGYATFSPVFKVSGTTSNATISNIECRNVEGNCFDVSGATSITLSNLVAHTEAKVAAEAYGIYMHGNMYGKNFINDCEVYNCKNYGLVTGNILPVASGGGTIELNRCVAHHNGSTDGFRDAVNTSTTTWNDCISYNNYQDGWDLFNTSNKKINRCKSYNNGAAGFKLGPTTGGNSINYSVAYGNGDAGFRSNTGDNITLYNNVSYNNNVGYELYYGGGSVLKNNIGYNNNTANFLQGNLSNNDENNIWYQDSSTGVNVQLKGINYRNSDLAAYKAASGTGRSTLFSNPLLVNTSGNDFSIKAGSPAINAGVYVGLTEDIIKNPIAGNPDIGAFEYQTVTVTPSTPPADTGTSGGTSVSTIPVTPGNLSAVSTSRHQVNLKWTDNSGNESGFKIEQCLDSAGCSSFTLIATVAANATSYSSSGLRSNTTYGYRVRAYNSSGNSPYSNVVKAKTTGTH